MKDVSLRRIAGRKACVEPFRLDDAALVAGWKKDAGLVRQILGSPSAMARRPRAVRESLKRTLADPNQIMFSIRPIGASAPIGVVRLMWIDWENGTADLGIYIGRASRRGAGLGSEALDLFVGEAFKRWRMRKICLKVGVSNRRAARLYRRFGFKQEGRLRRHVARGQKFEDVLLMSIFREDWTRKKGRAR